jgi:hypothetical protein
MWCTFALARRAESVGHVSEGDSVGEVVAAAVLPVGAALPQSEGCFGWGVQRSDQPHNACRQLPPLFIVLAIGAANHRGLGAPDQGAGQRARWAKRAHVGGDHPNTLELEMALCFLG